MRGPAGYRNYSRRARWIAWGLDLLARPAAPLLRLLAPPGPAPERPRTILVARLDHLGDLLMTTPAVSALRRAYPDARIDLLAAPWGAAAIERNPDIDRVLFAVAPWYDPRTGEPPAPAELLRSSAALRRESYDWAFDMRGDPRVVLLYLLPAARRRFGFSSLGLEDLLTDALPYDRSRSPLDLALDLAGAAGARAASRRPIFAIEGTARRRTEDLLRKAGLGAGAEFAVVAPGSNRPRARWGSGRYAALCDAIREAGLPVIVSGRPADSVLGEVEAFARYPPVALPGGTSFHELAALLERAVLLVSNDSAASHLAAAVGCPTVVLFGPGDPALSFPYEDGRRFVSLAAPIDHARPCFDPACDSDHGFPRILTEQVLAVCLRVADEGRRGRREAR